MLTHLDLFRAAALHAAHEMMPQQPTGGDGAFFSGGLLECGSAFFDEDLAFLTQDGSAAQARLATDGHRLRLLSLKAGGDAEEQ
jgi:hypothetical protein